MVYIRLLLATDPEIRNPLTSIKGFIELLLEKERDHKKVNYLQISLSEVKKVETIINDYFTFSKPL
ncbi:histidine kinase dimerization/phospho-acceptor domain-containing protein [Bacillus sp. DJP31]|uniref:histidine kinase dimerization/phospho-acceptor domain-containing protein n=1 Tax=Bacillus sp. DJP31 TaxID=3409789 RepID=UPI003BB65578